MCRSRPTLRMTSSTRTLVLTKTPMARESRQLMPVARTQTEVTNRLAAMAITMMTPQISQSGAVLSKPTHGGAEEQDKRQLWGPISQRGIKTEAQGSARQKRREN